MVPETILPMEAMDIASISFILCYVTSSISSSYGIPSHNCKYFEIFVTVYLITHLELQPRFRAKPYKAHFQRPTEAICNL